MKKFVIGGIATVLVVFIAAVGYFAILKATKDEADSRISYFLDEGGFYDYRYEDAYINPFTKTLHVKNITLDDKKYSIGKIALKQLEEDSDATAFKVEIHNFRKKGYSDTVRIKAFKADRVVLRMDEYWGDEWELKSIENPCIDKFEVAGKYSGKMKVSFFEYKGLIDMDNTFTNNAVNIIKDVSVDVPDENIYFKIDSVLIRQEVTKDKFYTINNNVELRSKDMGDLDAGFVFIGLDEIIEDPFYDLLVKEFSLDYTDNGAVAKIKTLVGFDKQRFIGDEPFYMLENGDEITNKLTAYLENPGRIEISGKSPGGRDYYPIEYMLGGEILDIMDITISIDGDSPVELTVSEDYIYDYGWYHKDDYTGYDDDYNYHDDYYFATGGRVVDFISASDGMCGFKGRNTGESYSFKCTEDDAEYFTTYENPFYIEYDYTELLAYITINEDETDGWEDWDY